MIQMVQALKIEKGVRPRERPTKFDFGKMKVGDKFYYEGARSSAVIQFGSRLVRGKYRTERESDGWRLWLLKDIKPFLLESTRSSKYNFDEMETGKSSFFYEGSRSVAITALAYRLAAGRYKIHKEGDGWVFELTRSIKLLIDD